MTSLPLSRAPCGSVSPPIINLWNFSCVSMKIQHSLKLALLSEMEGTPRLPLPFLVETHPPPPPVSTRDRCLPWQSLATESGPQTPNTRPFSASPGPIMVWWGAGRMSGEPLPRALPFNPPIYILSPNKAKYTVTEKHQRDEEDNCHTAFNFI